MHAFDDMKGREIYVKKIPYMKLTDIALAIDNKAKLIEVGIRPSEELHEQLILTDDAPYTYEYLKYYNSLPAINDWGNDPDRIRGGVKVVQNFRYSSNNKTEWIQISELQ